MIGVDDLPVGSLAVPALTTIGMDLTAAAGSHRRHPRGGRCSGSGGAERA
ncbi:hypothetical protein ACIP39_29000 [Streptomyces tibetensis]